MKFPIVVVLIAIIALYAKELEATANRWVPNWSVIRPREALQAPSSLPVEKVRSLRHQTKPFTRGTRNMRAEGCGIPNTKSGRIVGGSEAAVNEFPWQVAVFIDERFFCGGTLISDEWVLTAAHCIEGGRWFLLYLGAHNIQSQEPFRTEINATNYVIHPSWDPLTLWGDLALIQLPEKISFTDIVYPVCLPLVDENHNHTGEAVVISGWGRISDTNTNLSPTLRKATGEPITNAECEVTYGPVLNDGQICMSTVTGASPCIGDNGGPMSHLEEVEGIFEQIGIFSFGAASGCERRYPVGFTFVDAYLDWISNITGVAV